MLNAQWVHAPILLILLAQPLSVARSAELRWEHGPGYRSAPLPIPGAGRTGFLALPSSSTGITFTNHLSEAAAGNNRILENGSGVALGDIDGDGLCDIYFCAIEGSNVLYKNLGNWKFVDITESAGVACPGQHSTGAVFADVDGDGDLDLLVNCVGGGTRLFLNDGKGHFTESTNSGLLRKYGATSMALADVDGNGTLDLYVANYRTTNYKDNPPDARPDVRVIDGKAVVSPEDRFSVWITKDKANVVLVEKGEPDVLYLNDGKAHFAPVPWTNGAFLDEQGQALSGPPLDWGLSVMFRDLNGDGSPDIYVSNDFMLSRDRAWLNDGRGRFRALPSLARRNMSMSSMSVDFADINRDGYTDFFVADMLSRSHVLRQTQQQNMFKGAVDLPVGHWDFSPEVPRNTLYVNRGDGTFAEIAQLSGLQASEWSWSAIFLDVDLDGYEDLLISNGNNHDVLDADTARELTRQGRKPGVSPLLKYPRLETASLAFRNRGDLTFEETGAAWGFNTVGISQGMALADLDNDGDLDVVVNNLNRAAGIFRNESIAPRIAVRLNGLPPNRNGIGATIRVEGGPVQQSQEMICGGRYLSGDQAMRVFAAGSLTNVLTIRVTWRSGKQSVVNNAHPNRLYEIDEPSQTDAPAAKTNFPSTPTNPPPLFADVSQLLESTQKHEPFDDFARQPLLPTSLSRLGPGVSWFDIDGDGWDDLIVGGEQGGRIEVFHNNGTGAFIQMTNSIFARPLTRAQTTILGWRTSAGALLLAGSSNYEDGRTNEAALQIYDPQRNSVADGWHNQLASIGPLAMADVDGDGALDLFAGARVLPGRFPEPPSSRLYHNDNGIFRIDIENSRRLQYIGMVSGAVFSDLDGDGYPELILACDWGPIRVLHNDHGKLTEVTEPLRLSPYLGRWNGVAVGDFDGDGRLDIVASNWGRNTKYQNRLQKPLQLFYGRFNGDSSVQPIEAYYDEELKKIVPWASFDSLSAAIPFLSGRFSTYRTFGNASVEEILGDQFKAAQELKVTTFDSMIFLNRGDHFEAHPLPIEAQFAPAFGLVVGDFDGDGCEDIFLGQNFFGTDPETSRYDGGLGLLLKGDGTGHFQPISARESCIRVYGEQRGCAAADFDGDGRLDLVVTQNGAQTRLYHNIGAKPGLRVRLEAGPENPFGIGAVLRLVGQDRQGPARELHSGSGYWSQDSTVSVLTSAFPANQLWIRWPGGKSLTAEVPPGAAEIQVSQSGEIKRLR
jgi:hypothetical protein